MYLTIKENKNLDIHTVICSSYNVNKLNDLTLNYYLLFVSVQLMQWNHIIHYIIIHTVGSVPLLVVEI